MWVTRIENIDSFLYRDGQTREIASYLASELKEMGIWADVVNLHRAESRTGIAMIVVIGASIRYMVILAPFGSSLEIRHAVEPWNAERLLF